jgi:hypothetical protein
MMGKKASFDRRFRAVPGESASKGVIKSLKTLFQSGTSRNAQEVTRPRATPRDARNRA